MKSANSVMITATEYYPTNLPKFYSTLHTQKISQDTIQLSVSLL